MNTKQYICPIDMFNGEIKKGTIYQLYNSNSSLYIPISKPIPKALTYSIPKEIVETWKKYKEELKYNKGDYLYCIKDLIMESGLTAFTKNKIYLSEYKESLTNNSGNNLHGIPYDLAFEYFRLATSEEVEKGNILYIGAYPIKRFPDGGISIDGHVFTQEWLEAALIIAEHSKSEVIVGCDAKKSIGSINTWKFPLNVIKKLLK